jgi:hypothetical protein
VAPEQGTDHGLLDGRGRVMALEPASDPRNAVSRVLTALRGCYVGWSAAETFKLPYESRPEDLRFIEAQYALLGPRPGDESGRA